MVDIDNPLGRLENYFADGGWELYDGVPVLRDSVLTVSDILCSVTLNSRLNTRRQVWQVWKKRERIEEWLEQVPPSASILGENLPWVALRGLFREMCEIPDIAGAKATKILHKKRPELIPVYDSVTETFCKQRIQGWSGMSWADAMNAYIRVLREELIGNKDEVDSLCQKLGNRGWPVTPLRVLELLIWTELEPNGEYR